MARPAKPEPARGQRRVPPRGRRAALRVTRSLSLRTTGLVFLTFLALMPVAIVTAGQDREAAGAGARAQSETRLRADAARLRLAVARENAGLQGYVLTHRQSSPAGYDTGRRQAEAAWLAVIADAGDAGFQSQLPLIRSAFADWQAWAAEQAAGPASGPGGTDAASLQGDRLLGAVQAAVRRLEASAAAAAVRDGARADAVQALALRGEVLLHVLSGVVVLVLAFVLVRAVLRPVSRLANAATMLAGGAATTVPYTRRRNEVGSLARALTRWQKSEVARKAILELSPVGIFTFTPDLDLVDVNPALRAMFGVPPDNDSPFSLRSFIHPDDREASRRLYGELSSGARDHLKLEQRLVRTDGSVFWGGLTAAVVRRPDGSPLLYVCVIEDVSERKDKLDQAARVQRNLLPPAAPDLEGYELTGLCRPGREMGGDFFDWYVASPGHLTLTLGDVTGKDMQAALLMAMVRIALRASARRATVAETVRSAAASTYRQLDQAGAFVTLFHGRLDLDTGLLSCVSAGHGLAVVASEGGVRRLPGGGALPLGVLDGQPYAESTARLESGDALVVLSDGVLQRHPELGVWPEQVEGLLKGARDAQEMAERLTDGPARLGDDITVVVLRRLPLSTEGRTDQPRRGRGTPRPYGVLPEPLGAEVLDFR